MSDPLIEFVEQLLADWEGAEAQAMSEFGVGDDFDRMEVTFAERRAEWATLRRGAAQ